MSDIKNKYIVIREILNNCLSLASTNIDLLSVRWENVLTPGVITRERERKIVRRDSLDRGIFQLSRKI